MRGLGIAIILLGFALPARGMKTYHVGNSLTHDSDPSYFNSYAMTAGLGSQVYGEHVRPGSSLTGIWDNPTDYYADFSPLPFGSFTNALPNYHWDAVTLQTYPSGASGMLSQDLSSFLNFIDLTRSNPANANTIFYLLAAWPPEDDYAGRWLAPSNADDDGAGIQQTRAYSEHLITRIRQETDAKVFMVPSGEVIYQLSLRIGAGQVPGITSLSQLYRDGVHLSSIGQYVASVTMFSTMYKIDPRGLGLTFPDPAAASAFTPQLYDALNNAVWDTVSTYPYTGVAASLPGDLNGNGGVDAADYVLWRKTWQPESNYNVWRAAFNSNAGGAGDFNADGHVDAADFVLWRKIGNAPFYYNSWQTNFARRAGDFDFDGSVSAADYVLWRKTGGAQADYNLFRADFGSRATGKSAAEIITATIPEPSTFLLIVFALIARRMIYHRRSCQR